jgi:nitroreductase
MTEFDLAQTDLLLSTTRSVRRRLDLERAVPDDIVLECIRLSMQAPTGSNSQGWRWMVVTDQEKRTRLAELYREIGSVYLAGYEGDAQTTRTYSSANYLLDVLDRVPVHVIPCIKGRLAGTQPIIAASFLGSIFPAVWSFQLALRSRGLGSCLTTLHLGKEAEAAELLGIPDDVTQVGLLPVAWTKGTDFKPAERPPPERITYWNEWKATR